MRRLFPDNTFVAPKMPHPERDLVRLVIAEAPGADEAEHGEPLIGGAGRTFSMLLEKARIPRAGLTIANCIQCRPPDNIFPTDNEARKYISKEEGDEAVKHCFENHLKPLLLFRPWKRVDLLGDKPLRLVAGRSGGVFKWRGSPLEISVAGVQLRGLATLHPAYLMRDQVYIPVAVNDLLKPLEIPEEHYNPYPSLDDVQNFKSDRFAFDIETRGFTKEIVCVGLSDRVGHAICVPFRGAYIPELRRIFANAKEVVGHNSLQFDLPILRDSGVAPGPSAVLYDTMLLQHLCFPDFPHDLEFVGSQFVSKPAWKHDKASLEVYCCRDTDVTFQVWQDLWPLTKKNGLDKLYLNVQVPLAKICRLMHETGFKVDPNRIQFVREKLLTERNEQEKLIPEWLRTRQEATRKRVPAPPGTLGKSGKPVKYVFEPASEQVVPWRSTEVKRQYLYSNGEGCLGFDPILDPKSGNVTTGKLALDKLYAKSKNLSLKALKRLNQLDEVLSTFAKADMVKVDRVFPHFNVHGTASGRLSSSDPNLQNIPESARFIYVPSHAGWKIVDVDYSQIENRLTAFFAGDAERLRRFAVDPKFSEHRYAASLFLGIAYEDVEKDNDKDAPYGKAKRIVHGTNYGMGYKKISNLYDMELKDTKALQDTWKKAIWPTIQWQTRIGEEAKRRGYLTTPFGRKRWFYTQSYYTEALSFIPQSTAADVIFRAMIGLMYERIGMTREQAQRVTPICIALPKPARLLIQVHDSLVFECPEELVDDLVDAVTKVMCQPWPELKGMSIPIGVKVGDSWGECEDYEKTNKARREVAALHGEKGSVQKAA